MKDGDIKLTEAKAIMMYISAKYKPSLLGSSASEVGRIEMLHPQVDGLRLALGMGCYLGGDRD